MNVIVCEKHYKDKIVRLMVYFENNMYISLDVGHQQYAYIDGLFYINKINLDLPSSPRELDRNIVEELEKYIQWLRTFLKIMNIKRLYIRQDCGIRQLLSNFKEIFEEFGFNIQQGYRIYIDI